MDDAHVLKSPPDDTPLTTAPDDNPLNDHPSNTTDTPLDSPDDNPLNDHPSNTADTLSDSPDDNNPLVNHPVGVFDSGLGGLTAIRSLWRILPGENLIYFGDTARVPYGSRSRDTILQYARQDVRFLRTFHLKAIVIACGTISTTSLTELRQENADLPVIGVVDPVCARAAAVTRNGRVGVIATAASIRSGAYETALHKIRPALEVFTQPCPLFVPLVENGRFHRGDIVIQTVAREYLTPLLAAQIDTLILGCTHYPLLADVIGEICGPDVTLVSAGEESAFELKRLLKASGLRANPDHPGHTRFYVSDRTEDFEHTASVFLQHNLYHTARRVDIEQF